MLVSNTIFAQSNFSIDTSYTEKSVYIKLIKKYPFIKIPQFQVDNDIEEIKNVVYQQKGRPLHLDAFLYKKQKFNPAVIMIHGGGWRSGNKNQMHILAQQIALKGYSCFPVEYKLSLEAKYPAGVIDVKNAVKFIKDNAKKFNVNPDKIAVLGCSTGGEMAALIGTTNENLSFENETFKSRSTSRVQAIVNIDGVLAFKHPESSEGEMASFWLTGSFEEKPEIWNNASALTHTDRNTPPILFINSGIDRFHAGRDDMIKILDENKIYSEVKTIKDSPHSFWFFYPWLGETVLYTTQFLDKIFKNKLN